MITHPVSDACRVPSVCARALSALGYWPHLLYDMGTGVAVLTLNDMPFYLSSYAP